jgi:hypothetical protein
LIAGALLTALGVVLAWGFRKRLERFLKGPKGQIHEKEELKLLISPLYAKLNKNDEIVDFMTTYKVSRLYVYDNSHRAELEKLEEDIKEIMLQYHPIAPDRLYKEIKTFLDLRPDWEQKNSWEAKKVLWNIMKLVKDRQEELRETLKSRDEEN